MLDFAINYGTVVDTQHRRLIKKHVGIWGGRITELSDTPLNAAREINADGLIVSPGFIDAHGHVDGQPYSGELSACQGITTTVGGNCGLSPMCLKTFFEEQEKHGFFINQAEMVGHSFSLRHAIGLTDEYAPADCTQIRRMAELADQALSQGACGVSFGLDYSPGASLDEVIALSKVGAKYNRICSVHSRLFTEHDLYSLYELFTVAKLSRARMLLSHFVYQYCASSVNDALQIVEDAKSRGLDIMIDSGMYTSWSTYVGTATYDPQLLHDNNLHYGNMVVATVPYIGRTLDEELLLNLRKNHPDDSVIYCEGTPEDVYECLKRPYAMPSTDTGEYKKGEGHPQIAGSFPKYIKEMVRDQKLLSLEEAVFKATLLPASTFGFKDKGIVKPGMDADLVLFDPVRICDMAQFPHEGLPDAKPEGIPYVFVQGRPAVDGAVFTGERSGRVIRL